MESGIICVNKCKDMTSFDVVAKIRRILGIKRTGHLGTLDPMAEGVLPVAFGTAARIMDYLDADIKEYSCSAILGLETDTLDIWGKTLSERDGFDIDEERLIKITESFAGVSEQTPPMYSAIHVNGKRLYEYAREGKTCEVKKRKIYIESIRFDGIDGNEFSFTVRCTKGTYVRSICADIGAKYGIGAAMSRLVRTKSGYFDIGSSIPAERLAAMDRAELEEFIISPDKAMIHFGIAEMKSFEARLFSNGVTLEKGRWKSVSKPEFMGKSFHISLKDGYDKSYRVYAEDGMFLGVGVEVGDGSIKADKVFCK